MLLPQRQHAVDAGGDPRRRGMGFHQHIHQMKTLAEPVLDHRRVPAVGIGARKAAGAFDACRRGR